MRLDRCFVTGCDQNTEWMLPWFLKNYRKHNIAPIIFCDFGVGKEMLSWVEKNFDGVIPFKEFERETIYLHGPRWYLKPVALMLTDSYKRVWLDTDCEVLGNISGVFERLVEHKINIVRDVPWTKQRKEHWFNTGVVGIVGKSSILYDWYCQCKKDNGGYTAGQIPRGDQDSLKDLLGNDDMKIWTSINELPNEYNWLRIQLKNGQNSPKKLIVHWTGIAGKEEIRRKING